MYWVERTARAERVLEEGCITQRQAQFLKRPPYIAGGSRFLDVQGIWKYNGATLRSPNKKKQRRQGQASEKIETQSEKIGNRGKN